MTEQFAPLARIVLVVAAGALVLLLGLRRLLPAGLRQRGGTGRVFFGLSIVFAGLAIGMGGMGVASPGVLLYIVAVVALLGGLVVLGGLVLFDLLLPLAHVEVPSLVRDLILGGVTLVGVLGFLRLAGLDVFSLVTTSAVLTAVIGLALQTTIANVFGGLALQLDRTLGHGDWIKVHEDIGQIFEIGWRSTRILTKDGDTVFVPNGEIVTGRVLNFSRPTGTHRVTVRVGFHYRHPPDEVSRALVDATRDVPGVLESPAPDCLPLEFGDSAIVYGLRYWIGDFARDVQIDGAVRSRIWYAARRAGLEMPYPIRTVVQPSAVDGDEAERATRDTLLSRVEVFAPLDDDDRAALGRGLHHLEFAAGEQIVRQGEMGDSLYLVRSGEVGVNLTIDGVSREVARIGAGEFFGEMAVMTGEVRTATCIACGAVSCYRLDHDTLRAVLDAKPEIAERLSAVLAMRQATLDGEREGLSAEARARRASQVQSRLLARIQQFFRPR